MLSNSPLGEEKPNFTMPIDGSKIPGFQGWVDWSGFGHNPVTVPLDIKHEGFDFAFYREETHDNIIKCVVGLPKVTKVRAVASGRIKSVCTENRSPYRPDIVDPYLSEIFINHGPITDFFEHTDLFSSISYERYLHSSYSHVVPKVEQGQEVKKGDVIGELYSDLGDERGRLVHLHFQIYQYFETAFKDSKEKMFNPTLFLPQAISWDIAFPQGDLDFHFGPNSEKAVTPIVTINNFEEVLANCRSRNRDGIIKECDISDKGDIAY